MNLGVKATDDKTLEIQLETPVPYFKAYFLSQHSILKTKNSLKIKATNTVLKLTLLFITVHSHFLSGSMSKALNYLKTTDYWDADNVKLKEVNFNIVKDTATGVNLYETNKADIAGLSAEFVDKYKS